MPKMRKARRSVWAAFAAMLMVVAAPAVAPAAAAATAESHRAGGGSVSSVVAAAPTIDVALSRDRTVPAVSLTTPTRLTTSGPNELLVAYVNAADPAGTGRQQVLGMAGGHLQWNFIIRSIFSRVASPGVSEIWWAWAPSPVSVFVSATLDSPATASMTVIAFKGAASKVQYVSAGGSDGCSSGLVTRAYVDNSLIVATGSDWSRAATPIAAPGQQVLHSLVDPSAHQTFWVQRISAPLAAGAPATVRDLRIRTGGVCGYVGAEIDPVAVPEGA